MSNRTGDTVNGVSSTYTFDNNDRLSSHGFDTYSYDDNGNTVSEVVDGQSNTYSYDSQNRLTEANMGGLVQTMAYDPDGVRIQKEVGGVSTDYLTDSNRDYAQVLYERSATSELNYTFGTDLVGLDTGAEQFTYHTDALGSTRLLTNDSGTVADDVRYDAWGEVLAGGNVVENQYLYTGEQFDSGLGKTYLRARYYDSGVGRFSQMDTFKGVAYSPITQNKYMYGNAEPTSIIDPSGHFGSLSFGAASRGLSAMLTSASSAGSALLGQAAGATIRLSRGIGSKLALRYVKQCIKKPDKCRIKLNMLIVGNDVPTMVEHIGRAQMKSPRTFRLTWDFKNKGKGHKRWYYKRGSYLGGCGAVEKPSPKANCDEYPMQSTTQGGELKYNSGRVSLQWVDGAENKYVGSHFGGMTGKMKRNKNYNFFVITTQSIPTVGLVFGKKKR